tara:strand:+ start:3129 stop:3653 length:525 start_codon:yes stop_codon:yes gene_type:complete
MSTPRKIPINRVNKFFSNEDFDLDISMGREAIEGDGNFTVILYRVDRENTASDDLYGEAPKDGVKFFPPVELKVIPTLDEAENKAYNNGAGSLRYLQDGNLTFGIYTSQLAELDAELSYGDYIGYPVSETEVRYFSVTNDGVKNYDNKHTIMGYKGAYRTVKCAPVDEQEFRGL